MNIPGSKPKERIAVSINICPWQDLMQFGIKVLGTHLVLIGSLEEKLWGGKVTR